MGDRNTGVFDIAAAFVFGAMLGAGLALVLAPHSGEKTRKELGKKSRRWKKDAEKRMRDTGGEWIDEAEERIDEWSKQIAEVVESGVETIRETVTEELKSLDKKLGSKKGLFR
jgi:gas vesicle protein